MAVTTKSISFISQNTGGWTEQKVSTLSTVIRTHGISFCCLQEHMRLEKNLYKIGENFKDFCVFSLPAHKKTNIISKGRPAGGLAILYKRNLEQFITEIVVPDSRRVQAIHFKQNATSFVLINVYFPTDPQNNNFCDKDLLSTIHDIHYVFNMHDESTNFILMGDFNCEFLRNNRFVQTVNHFMEGLNLMTIWDKFPCDFTYMHHVPNNNGQHNISTIDHIMVQEQFIDSCVEGCVIHLGENLSNHEILYLKIKVDFNPETIYKEDEDEDTNRNRLNIPKWNKATSDQINSLLQTFNDSLNNMDVPINALYCRDVHCSDDGHINDLDAYGTNILESLQSAVEKHIPNASSIMRSIPGWHEYITPIKNDMNFWYSVWVSAGRPQNTVLHNVYKNVRHQYHYAVRKVKNYKREIQNNNYINAATNGKINDLLKDLKHQRKPAANLASTVDSRSDPQDISDHFGSIYKKIYNHHDDQNEVSDISDKIQQNLSDREIEWFHDITPQLIRKLINKLKLQKNDESFTFKSDAFKVTSFLLSKPLCHLIKGYLIHGHFTERFLFSSLVPIVKDNRKSKSDTSNYRLIAVSSILLKLIDLLILELFSDQLKVSNLQFGYQANSSTMLCSWTVRECINYYANRGSSVYVCLLDLTKAFDNIKLSKLFTKLSEKLPAIFVRFIIYTYIKQRCYVKWGHFKSPSFTVSNGVRQGAVASPIFFNLYMDKLFTRLKDTQLGCKIDNYDYSTIGYADDLTLLSASRQGLQSMVNLVREYCDEFGIKISINVNPKKSKTKCLIINSKLNPVNIKLYGISIPYVTRWNHLGTMLQKDEKSDSDINRCRGEFIGNIHSLHQELGLIDPYVFFKLVNIYFTSFYGCVLWNLECPLINRLYATWNTMIQNTFDLPYGTHRFILKHISNKLSLKEEFYSRFRKFCQHIEKSNKSEVIYLYNIQKYDSRSTFGNNYRNVIAQPKDILQPYRIPPEDKWKLSVIEELILVKCNRMKKPVLSYDDCDIILRELCCN